jgi:lipoate---protein ligase
MRAMPGPLSADYKVPGGKLLRVRLALDESHEPPVIHSVKLTGDFFMHPEDAIEELERRLVGAPWEAEAVRDRVSAFYDMDVQVIGAGVDDLVHIIMAARGEEGDAA